MNGVVTLEYFNFSYDNLSTKDIANEGLKEFGKKVWITIKNLFMKIYTWFKNLLLNINYFKNAQLDDQMNKDLIQVLKLCQPRTELNFKILSKFYGFFKMTWQNPNTKFDGIVTGVSVGSEIGKEIYGYTTLTEEINKSISDIDDSMNAARSSTEMKRIEEDKYEHKNVKMIPLSNIIPDMKKSQSSSASFHGELKKIENIASNMDKPDDVTKRLIVFLNKVINYYTFRINLLTKYFTKAKASLKGTLNNITQKKNEEFQTKTTTKRGKIKRKIVLNPGKLSKAKELYSQCINAKNYEEYKPLYDELSTILNVKGHNIEKIQFDIGCATVITIKNNPVKIPVSGRTLYHTSMAQNEITEITPSFRTAAGILFPEPRVYVHIGVPLNRFAGTVDEHGDGGLRWKETVYVVTDNISTVYKDPEMGRTASYIVSSKPVKVKRIDMSKFNEKRDKEIDLSFSKKEE